MSASSVAPSASSAVGMLDAFGTIAGSCNYEPEPTVRSLVALGTTLLLPSACGDEARRVAKERGIQSMVERAGEQHGVKARAVAEEILSILS